MSLHHSLFNLNFFNILKWDFYWKGKQYQHLTKIILIVASRSVNVKYSNVVWFFDNKALCELVEHLCLTWKLAKECKYFFPWFSINIFKYVTHLI